MKDFKSVIEAITVRILEDWAMMLVEPAEDGLSSFAPEEDFYICSIRFQGVVQGGYFILCQKPFLETLAGNLLGTESEFDEEEIRDVLQEMANVLCGNLLTECYGEDTVFDVVLPKVEVIDSNKIEEFDNARTVVCLADDEPLAVTYSLEV